MAGQFKSFYNIQLVTIGCVKPGFHFFTVWRQLFFEAGKNFMKISCFYYNIFFSTSSISDLVMGTPIILL